MTHTTTQPSVTVLTAVRNGARYLDRTIESIRRQTFADWEYILVDDASDDETGQIIERYAADDGRFRYVRRDRAGGPYVAANDGLRLARGKYIVRLDGDDVSDVNRIERQLAFLDAHPRLRACLGYWQAISADDVVDSRIRTFPSSPGLLPWLLCVLTGYVHSSACIERATLEELGGYVEAPTSQDFHLWCSLSRRRQLGVAPFVVVYWRQHSSQLSSRQNDLQYRTAVEIIREHISCLTGDEWNLTDAENLWRAGRALPLRVGVGLDVLDRFREAWSGSMDLDDVERDQMAKVTSILRVRHLRWRLRDQPLSTILNVRRAIPDLARVATSGPQIDAGGWSG